MTHVLDTAQSLPSYDSVFKRVKAAKQESYSGFAKSMLSIFVGAIFAGAGMLPSIGSLY